MFKKLEEIGSQTKPKSSITKQVRDQILKAYPVLEPYFETHVFSKKSGSLVIAKPKAPLNHISILVNNKLPLFFQGILIQIQESEQEESKQILKGNEESWIPNLRLVHQFPDMLTAVQIDKGGLKPVLNGANIMCPGLTSKGGILPEGLNINDIVQVRVEGKQHAIAIGRMLMTSQEVQAFMQEGNQLRICS